MLSDAGSAHTIRWVRSLAQRGHEIRIFTLTPVHCDAFSDLKNVSVAWQGIPRDLAREREGSIGKLMYLRALMPLRAEIRRWRPDLVHAHYASSYGLLGMLAGARPRVVSVWGMDVYSFPRRTALHRRLMMAVLASADAVFSTSRTMREQVWRLIDRPIDVTPFGVDTERFRPGRTTSRHADDLTVGTVKALEPKYGIEFLLRAFAIALRSGAQPDRYRLVIVGGGSLLAELQRLAIDLGVANRVHFAGPCNYDVAHEWHQSFDIGVYPSIDSSESFGVAAVESQACGVPVIVSDVGGLPEIVVDGRTGLVVPAGDAEALAAAICRLLNDRATREGMGWAARQHVIDNYSLVTCTDIMEAAYDRVLARSGSPSRRVPGPSRPS
jgi:glycosyltransferase involved in cell wall biosynthesis